ncbi:hypothetical protein DACRYDRAFT_111866 [Dacryopinax primogenitus]|uniref:BHLH domain-containing protein n=1 Tax=Dacryopinax primogenitus (strain DJM 731) TaxID=1858805 RepID=M5G0J3_DACPD|nr:uncharacterized protein DACRYDRAFT_111866 [Dacryopinax primogenitus]EJT97322.1 hypothetical protein DACRYDRAFT_111866 [Dacryopinax primogenitus]
MHSPTARRSSIFNILEDAGPPSTRPPLPLPMRGTVPRTIHAGPSAHQNGHHQPQPPPLRVEGQHHGTRTNPIRVPSGPSSPSSRAHSHSLSQSSHTLTPQPPAVHPALQPFSPDLLPPNPFNSPRRRAKKTAEKRALHNEIERRRRCNLNESVLTLGRLIPSLQSIHRPSQNQILTSTLAYVQQQQRDQAIVAHELGLLYREAQGLREEVNGWRERAGRELIEQPERSEDFQRLRKERASDGLWTASRAAAGFPTKAGYTKPPEEGRVEPGMSEYDAGLCFGWRRAGKSFVVIEHLLENRQAVTEFILARASIQNIPAQAS